MARTDPASPQALGWTPEQHASALRYARERWTLWFVRALGGMAALAALTLTGVAGRLERALSPRCREGWRRDLLVAAFVVAILQALELPLDLVAYRRELAYGFATQSLGSWLGDRARQAGVESALALAGIVPLWALMRRMRRWWWAAGAAGAIVLLIVVATILPVFIAPLFNSFRPLPDGPLRETIVGTAREHGIEGAEVLEVDASRQSRHDNAYVSGLLGTQRIVLYDTLIQSYTTDEIAFVLAHEIGHYTRHHIGKGIAASSVAIVAGFWLLSRLLGPAVRVAGARARIGSPRSIAALPLVLLLGSAYGFVLQPVGSAVSRHLEHEADLYALRSFSDRPGWRAVAVSSFQKMAARNLTDPDPPEWIEWFLFSHPSAGRRIRLCATWGPGP